MKRSLNRNAYSLIELMVVIGLIALLSVMLVIGIDKMRTNGKRQQTRLTFMNLQGMFSEYDSTHRVPFGMGHIVFKNMAAAQQTAMLDAIYLACPGNVTTDGGTDRAGYAVQFTRDFVGQLIQSPTNAAALGKMSAGATMTFATAQPTGTPWAVSNYNVYDQASVSATDTTVMLRTQVYTDQTGALPYGSIVADDPQNAPPNPYFWIPRLPVILPTLPLSTPVFLDAWNNPIIFVMGGALGARPANAAAPAGAFLTAGGNHFQLTSPDFRPFFASAGPDGDFSKGDDNMYSFEK